MSDDTCVSADKAVIRELLVKHGYNPDLEPQFRSGPPGEFDGYVMAGGEPVPGKLRNWVCELDGVIIDGHQGNYPEYIETDCRLCGKDLA